MQAVDNKYLLTVKLLEETFKSHNLSKDNFIFAVDTVLSLSLSDDLLAQFVITACRKTNTGMFALTYNSQLDIAINSRSRESVISLAVSPFFPELFENSNLSESEYKSVSRFVKIEYKSLLAVLKRGTKLITTTLVSIFEPDLVESSIDLATEGEIRKGAGIYTKCHEEVCYYDIGESEGSPSSVESKMLVPDIGKDFDVPFVYCFDRMEIIQALATGKINPRTGKEFSEAAFKLLNDKLHTEIKLYNWYLSNSKSYQVNTKKDSITRITRPSSS